jgi:hypothetical protein
MRKNSRGTLNYIRVNNMATNVKIYGMESLIIMLWVNCLPGYTGLLFLKLEAKSVLN